MPKPETQMVALELTIYKTYVYFELNFFRYLVLKTKGNTTKPSSVLL